MKCRSAANGGGYNYCRVIRCEELPREIQVDGYVVIHGWALQVNGNEPWFSRFHKPLVRLADDIRRLSDAGEIHVFRAASDAVVCREHHSDEQFLWIMPDLDIAEHDIKVQLSAEQTRTGKINPDER